MIVYADTSALAKRYLREAETSALERLWRHAETIATSTLTRIELPAALAKAQRLGDLSEREAGQALNNFLQDWRALVNIPMTAQLAEQGGQLAWRLGLRGYDAGHLASAEWLQGFAGTPITFACFDRRLWRAALDLGLSLYPDRQP